MSQSKSAARNVISFPASASKRSPRSKPKGKRVARVGRQAAPPSPDQELIRNIVRYAQAVAAFHAGFDADPDGDNKDAAGPEGQRVSDTAAKLLAEITRIPAKTLKGLQAKARIVPMVIKDACGSPDGREWDFFSSFASEVKEFLQPLVDAESKKAVQS